jgi:hypothetical protein
MSVARLCRLETGNQVHHPRAGERSFRPHSGRTLFENPVDLRGHAAIGRRLTAPPDR